MDYCGFDVADVSSYLYLTNEKGWKRTCGAVETTKAAIERRLKPFVRGGLSVAIEAGNQTAWIYEVLVGIGAKVIPARRE